MARIVLGTVHDASGSIVQGARIRLISAGENTSRETVSDAYGNYQFKKLDRQANEGKKHFDTERPK